ncbi:AraC family transcriptional regulator [Photobacterium halotolerans]|uniref:AraC family transcriptional regulator n=1 Tax=Photobacterium halotolerans TaxID=265726 RepID=UPI00137349CE|nr:AraC family transcriptional regulator [Photobacterium halotolerans]NAW86732.1 helix-turn-helix domain-containing protein [Photobacterium halotolerans]
MSDTMTGIQQELINLVNRHIDGPGLTETALPDIKLVHSTENTSCSPTIYSPMLCLLLQGEKRITAGARELLLKEGDLLLVPVMMPVVGEILRASEEQPYIGISIALDLKELTDLLITMNEPPEAITKCPYCIRTVASDDDILSVFKRFLALLDHPEDVPVMLPLLKRELMFRLLKSPVGVQLRQFLLRDTQANRISKVVELIQQRFKEPIRVQELADMVHMSQSSLFNAFKAVTSMTPLQFQKQLRLNEARRIMLQDGIDASAASYRVGYESPSHFNREYSRLFGIPPMTDISRLRGHKPTTDDRIQM